ncbi:hypothetical protein AB1K70_07415 [Bremerella sp. JC770]|uniref:hypothetical protein n=1 Tax=Bremerella sp. JC770 TaxID=3232137 RepID=UPI00345B294E
MPERELITESVVSRSGKQWGLRFSLGAMMVVVALFAGVFGYLSYYRSARCLMVYSVTTLPAQDLESLGLDFHPIDGSPYRWALDSDGAVTKLVYQKSQIERPLCDKQMTVASWPRQADTYTYIRFTPNNTATSPHPGSTSGEFAGFWGVRKVGGQLMFRVEGHAAHRQPKAAGSSTDQHERYDEVEGKLFYEGAFPESQLIFAAPVGPDQVHLFLIVTEEVSAEQPFVYQPGQGDLFNKQTESTIKQQDPQHEAGHTDE